MRKADVNGQSSSVPLDAFLMDEYLDKPPFRMLLVILTAGIITSLLPLLFLLNLSISNEILKWSIILFSGFVAGLAARVLLQNSAPGLQLAAAMSAVLVNLFILGWLTLNLIGFDWNPTDRLLSSITLGNGAAAGWPGRIRDNLGLEYFCSENPGTFEGYENRK